ncbi:MAG: M28 family peptidase [Isosphaeraceae bacterium]|nr:M28 family peptidase [Isosphaeraceae bacterium]
MPPWDRRIPRAHLALGLLALAAALAVGVPLAAQRLRTNEPVVPMKPPPIDGDRAYGYLKDLCAIGPRPAGSAANTKQRELVAKHFRKHGASLSEQPFSGRDPRSGEVVNMVNLVGSWHPERTERVLLGAHYDTRPFPDEDPIPANRTKTFLGANDGASGVALLMELAHHLNELPTPWGVDLVLFDGEEIVYGRGQVQEGEYFLGSKEFARLYAEQVDSGRSKKRYVAALVLDMVGDRDLQIDQEENSYSLHPGLVREVWAVARRLKATAFRHRVGRGVLDDHLPLNNVGIPAIDIIDFDYRYWHTAQDLPEHCSGASLEQVGRVVGAWLTLSKSRSR